MVLRSIMNHLRPTMGHTNTMSATIGKQTWIVSTTTTAASRSCDKKRLSSNVLQRCSTSFFHTSSAMCFTDLTAGEKTAGIGLQNVRERTYRETVIIASTQ